MAEDRFLSRRDFVRAGAAGAALLLGNAAPLKAEGAAKLPQRVLGKTGVKVPILGLGTVAVGNVSDRQKAIALLHKAIDLGVTYIDTAPPRTRIAVMTGYGRAQAYLKDALKERRKEVFLATKCLETDGGKAIDLLKKNLDELGLGQVDLAYTHSIGHAVYDFDELVSDKGPMAALEKAKKDGLTRFVGITGHNRPEKFAQVIARRDIDVMMNPVSVGRKLSGAGRLRRMPVEKSVENSASCSTGATWHADASLRFGTGPAARAAAISATSPAGCMN
jgi:hypothetical protein